MSEILDSWPRKMALSEYRRITYIGDKAPDPRTLQRRIARRVLPGEKDGRLFYVFVGPDNRPMWPQHLLAHPDRADESTADRLIREVMEES